MKNLKIIFLLMPFLFLACMSQKPEDDNCIAYDSGFSICRDTIFVDIKGEMTHALKYQDKYYILFEQRILKYGGRRRWLCVFFNGEIERTINCPKEAETGYLDFYVKNDTIILKPYMNEQCYYLNIQNYEWKKLDITDDLIFEDEKFYVYSLNFGEWGRKTWFKDKKTNKEYAIETMPIVINKIDTTYYLTHSFSVWKIEDPKNLNYCNDDVMYENIEINSRYYTWHCESVGYDVVYKDTTVNRFNFDSKSHIISSFVWQNELLQIYKTDTGTYITKINNDSMKIIQKIGEGLDFYNWHYSYRCKNLNGNNELLKFRTIDKQLFGLVDIIDNKLFIHYFKNKAELEPKSIGSSKADSIFVKRLNLILSNFGNLQLKNLDSVEQKWRTFDITPNHRIEVGDSRNPNNYLIDTCKSYLIQEDSLISNSIMYHAIQTNGLVRVISINWEKTSYSRYDLNELTREAFIAKSNFIENFLTQKLGQPTHIRKETKHKYPLTIWKTSNGLTVELSDAKNTQTDYYSIILTIYEN